MPLEGGRCSTSSLACATLGAYLPSGSLLLVTDPRCSVDVDVDIPAIAAIGWQSAGKSSLIEAISGITLPRASGTCTRRVAHIWLVLISYCKEHRCPTECQLEQTDTPWKCEVSLRFSHGVDGSPLPTTQTIPFGGTITDKLDVTDRIRRAQRAILSPSVSSDAFLSGADADHTESEVPFSPNCIVLRISGSDVTDLNFIDLPGSLPDIFFCAFNIMCRSLLRGSGRRDEAHQGSCRIVH
jgi:hypothetical protein